MTILLDHGEPHRAVGAGVPTLTVDLDAVAANTRLFARRTPGEVMAVVKADGFGLGAADVARTALAHGATRLGVTSLDEALALRNAGLGAPVLSWLNPVDADWRSAREHDVEIAVPGPDHLAAIVRDAPGTRVHLHLDTGLARDGSAPAAWAALCRAARAAQSRRLISVVGVMGHLACADSPGHPANAVGRARFVQGVATARAFGLNPAQRHLAATAATLHDQLSHHTMSRIGAGLAGIDPAGLTTLHGPVTLTAPLVDVREVRAGTPVGYGHTWTSGATRLGLVPVGYADGLPRTASGRGEVLVRGRRRPLVGRLSMDMAVVDLGDLAAGTGETVTVFGPGTDGEPTVREWAGWADTIEHEILIRLGSRLRRTIRPASAPAPLRSL